MDVMDDVDCRSINILNNYSCCIICSLALHKQILVIKMELGFKLIRGCLKLTCPPVESSGIFKIFEEIESFRKLIKEIVPVRSMSSCPNRNSLLCYTECKKATTGFMVNGIISWQQTGKRI